MNSIEIVKKKDKHWLTNTYLVKDRESSNGILIDAGIKPTLFDLNNLLLKGIFITHSHFDHTCCLDDWISCFPKVRVFGGEDFSFSHQLSDNDLFSFGNIDIKAISTPGHAKTHFCFLLNNRYLFSGDLLFKRSVGGTVAKGANIDSLIHSLKKILSTNLNLIVYPGHSEETTIREEQEENPFWLYINNQKEGINTEITVKGEKTILLLLWRDYDGGKKALIKYKDGKLQIVPGSWLN